MSIYLALLMMADKGGLLDTMKIRRATTSSRNSIIDHEHVTKYIASDDDNFNWVEETDHPDEEKDEHNEHFNMFSYCFNIRHIATLDDNHEMEGCKYMDEINDFELYIVDLTNNIFKQSTEDFNIFETEEIINEDVTDIGNAEEEDRVAFRDASQNSSLKPPTISGTS